MPKLVPAAIGLLEELVITSQVFVTPGFQNELVAATTLVRSIVKFALLLTESEPPTTSGIVKFVLPGALVVVLAKSVQR